MEPGAVVLAADDYGIIDTQVYSRGDIKESLGIKYESNIKVPFSNYNHISQKHVYMNGQEVFKFATSVCAKMVKECLKRNDLKAEDITYLIPHQANIRIIEFIAKLLKMDNERIVVNIDEVGNTSAASIPIILGDLYAKNKLKRGDKILIAAFGGGLTYGISLIEI